MSFGRGEPSQSGPYGQARYRQGLAFEAHVAPQKYIKRNCVDHVDPSLLS
jgi:hypothetical protein